ncbi:MAG: hypothetical protein WCL02_02615 [bacterium]
MVPTHGVRTHGLVVVHQVRLEGFGALLYAICSHLIPASIGQLMFNTTLPLFEIASSSLIVKRLVKKLGFKDNLAINTSFHHKLVNECVSQNFAVH